MSDAKHTKGPWETSTGIIPSLDKRAIAVCRADMKEGEKGTAVCVVAWESDANEKDLANARLIAAAPDMLAALEAITSNPHIYLGDLVYKVREEECQGWEGDAVRQWSEAVTAVSEAIKKAKGES
jgi:hypothetical protein